MHFAQASALFALSATLASAAPWGQPGKPNGPWATPTYHAPYPTGTSTSGGSGSGSGSGPSSFPFLNNGFPTPDAQQVAQIEQAAGGTLSNAPPPPNPGADGITNLQLIAFNELFEVAFFSDLLHNITTDVKGYTKFGKFDKKFVVDAITAIVAQEELHLLNANGALKHFGVAPIQPCQYTFPVADFNSAIELAATFTDVVLGTLQDVQQIFAENNDAGLVRGVGSVIGNEGEQEGFYRVIQGKRPSSAPFLTTGTRDFAFTALQSFVVKGSCPNENTIPLKVFQPLAITSMPEAKNSTLTFQVDNLGSIPVNELDSIVYISGQNLPVVVPITNQSTADNIVTFEASFPFEGGFSDGLTIAALVKGSGPFATADDVAKAAVFGPALIELN